MFDNPIAIGVAVIVIVLLVAGPKRLPTFGRGLGQGMREFKNGITGEAHEFKEGITGGSGEEAAKAGSKRVPHFGRGLGQGMREFKDGLAGEAHEFKEGVTGESAAPGDGITLKAPTQEDTGPTPASGSTGRESEPIA